MTHPLGKIYRRVVSLVRYGKISAPGVFKNGSLNVQIKHNVFETKELPVVQQYGFISNPPLGSDAVAVFTAGDQSIGTVIGTNHQSYRPDVPTGEVQMFDNAGNSIWLNASGNVIKVVAKTDIEIDAVDGKITLNCPNVYLTGNLFVAGNITDQSTGTSYSLAEMREFDRNHTHPGVQTGGGRTATSDYGIPDDGSD
jgi:phage gp45-like